jgi:hypothetical protein
MRQQTACLPATVARSSICVLQHTCLSVTGLCMDFRVCLGFFRAVRVMLLVSCHSTVLGVAAWGSDNMLQNTLPNWLAGVLLPCFTFSDTMLPLQELMTVCAIQLSQLPCFSCLHAFSFCC